MTSTRRIRDVPTEAALRRRSALSPRPSVAAKPRCVLAISLAASTIWIACMVQPEDFFVRTAIPVRSEVVRRGPFRAELVLLGTVRPTETVTLTAQPGGPISYPPRFTGGLRTGEEVAAEETLALLENEAARRSLAEAKLQAESAEANRQRSKRGLDQGVISQAEFAATDLEARLSQERLSSAQRAARQTVLKAPRAGRLVVSKQMPEGSFVTDGAVIAELAVGGPPRVEGWASPTDRKALRVDQEVRFSVSGGGEIKATGRIREVASVVDATGLLRVVVDVIDGGEAQGLPLPGEGVEMRVVLDERGDAITVPEEAIVVGSSGSSVFRLEASAFQTGRMKVHRTKVELGGRSRGRVEIMSGVSEGDRIVVSGASLIDEGTIVEDAAATPASGTGK